MTRLLHLILEIEDEAFDDDDAMGELIDVLGDHAKTGNIVELHTGEVSDNLANGRLMLLDDGGDAIPCYIRKVGHETVLD